MPDDDAPTPRDSGTLATFAITCAEAIEKLDALTLTAEVLDLRREAVALGALFRSWTVRTPGLQERAQAVNRLMVMHRAVSELVTGR